MYSQVQVPIPIHGDTIECVVKIKFVFVILLDDFGKNYLMDNNAQTTENWYLYNVPDRFRYHQKMLVLARYRYRYQELVQP